MSGTGDIELEVYEDVTGEIAGVNIINTKYGTQHFYDLENYPEIDTAVARLVDEGARFTVFSQEELF